MNSSLPHDLEKDVLIVDDTPDNLRVLSTTLKNRGYKARCVKNGSAALMLVSMAPPDLILLDVRMPGMDGYEVCQQLKADPATRDIPVIFLSALDGTLDKVKAFSVGGVDYITKPFHIEEVVARVENQFVVRHLQRQLVAQNQWLQREVEERKQTEVILRQEIQQRTLAEAALRDAKEAAEAANAAKNEFLSRMTHELRTPLNAILGFTHLLQSHPMLAVDQQEYLSSIQQNGESLLKLINNILSMTRQHSSHASYHPSHFDLLHLIKLLEQLFQPQASAKDLTLTVEWAADVPQYVHSDESILGQVLCDLLDNAIKFTAHGIVTLRVKTGSVTPAAQERGTVPGLIFEVEDTGSGIAPEELSHIFDAFVQTQTGHQAERGAGLGLAICQKSVRSLGGEIGVKSRLGEGTVFYVSLPLALDPTLAKAVPDSWNRASTTAFCFDALPCPLDISVDQLQTMPEHWISDLHWAAVRGFDQALCQLIRDIPDQEAEMAQVLMTWTNNFQFDKIIHLTQPMLEVRQE